jgi:hypothetical protein
MAYLTLLTALCISAVAAYYSIFGIASIFSGAAVAVIIMGTVLEIGKVVTAVWLHKNWNTTNKLMRSYLTVSVVVLMVLTSMGIFGFLSKAHVEQAGQASDAIAIVERIDGRILREENKIKILKERISTIDTQDTLNVAESIKQQETIRNGAWTQVQGDIDYNQQQINSVREQLTIDLESINKRESTLDNRVSELDKSVNDLRNRGIETIETSAAGVFKSAETETINYVEQANKLREQQTVEREEISTEKRSLARNRNELRQQANTDIKTFQDAIDKYRAQAQNTIDSANGEINRLREQNNTLQTGALSQIDGLNKQIDEIYNGIATLKSEKFEAESVVRGLEKEVGTIKYVAQLIFGGDDINNLDRAVQLFILMIISVFDPLAILLVIAASMSLSRLKESDVVEESPTDAADEMLIKTPEGWKRIKTKKDFRKEELDKKNNQ